MSSLIRSTFFFGALGTAGYFYMKNRVYEQLLVEIVKPQELLEKEIRDKITSIPEIQQLIQKATPTASERAKSLLFDENNRIKRRFL
jgi:hypothetical protein